ncbi:MAG TPA: APC family permease [Vicinamibacteria bacterium]|nr:APC family permease [Vicinamibacteria bacterium]
MTVRIIIPAMREGRLVRAIGRFDLTALTVNGVIGSSIFGMPAVLAALTGAWSPLAVLLGAAGILSIVLCHAEVASRFREPGGTYLYARVAFGGFVGFQAGWLGFWIRVTSMGANLNVFVSYLAELAPAVASPPGRVLAMVVVTALVTAVNVRGVRQSARTVDLFAVAKVAPLVGLVLLGVWRIRPEVLATQAVASPDWTQAVLLLVFAYGGFEAALIPAGEVRDPRRDAAFSLLVALAIVTAVYMLVQLAVVGLVPHAAGARAAVAAAYGVLLGTAGLTLASLAAMVSTYGWTLGSVLTSPRIVYSMAERGDLPAWLAHVHPRFRTPDLAIFTYAGAGLLFGWSGGFAANATLSAIVRLVTYGLVCAALVALRRRPDVEPAAFRLRAGWPVAALGLSFCGWLVATRTFAQAWILFALIALGAALWGAAGRGRGPGRAAKG